MTKQSCDPSELLYWPADDIHPPHDLISKWTQFYRDVKGMPAWWVLLRAAEYGADQELDLCAGYIDSTPAKKTAEDLVFARRSKTPGMEQALTALHAVAAGANDTREQYQDLETIRIALEALPDA